MPGPHEEEAFQRDAASAGAVASAAGPDAEARINQRLFETSLDLILVVDRRGTFLRVSPSALAILGYRPEEMVGYSAERFLYPDDLQNTRDEMRAARRNLVMRNFECRYVHKGGRVVRLWWTGVWVPDPGQHFFIGRDITEREEAARRIRADAERLALAVEISQIGLGVADGPEEFARVDAQFNRIYGRPEDKPTIETDEYLALICAEDRDRVAAGFASIVEQGGLYRGEFRISRPDTGEERWVRAVIRAGKRDSVEPRRFGAHLDITDLRVTQQQLQQAQKMEAIGQLTGGMAHDFNNLLGVVIGNLDLLRSGAPLDPDNRVLLNEALDAAERGADLIRRLLAFSRRQPLQPKRVALNELVAGIVGMLSRTLGENIPISLTLAADLWPVWVDPAQLEASLVNLATNARDAMPSGGQLIITTANRHLDADYAASHAELSPGDYVMVEVTDTGEGIPPDVLTHIFEPFFTTKEVGKGNGLGLSMVFGFVKQSGGHVNVYSEPGVGTTFRLYLPRGSEGAEAVAAADPAVPSAAGGGETVLVVEDNAPMRRIVRRQLLELGYRVVEAAGATEALEVLASERVMLLFSDVVMPGTMNGIALAKEAVSRWPGLKVILTSGFPDIRIGSNGEAVTGIRLLTKPYRRTDLAEAVREVLEGPA